MSTVALEVEAPGTDLALRPVCDQCGGFFEIRTGTMTPEQRFCGTWYDHPEGRCGKKLSSVLLPSPELLAQNAALTKGAVTAVASRCACGDCDAACSARPFKPCCGACMDDTVHRQDVIIWPLPA